MGTQALQSALTRIDENISVTQERVWNEVMNYLERNQDEAVRQLASKEGRVHIPTSLGDRSLSLEDIQRFSK